MTDAKFGIQVFNDGGDMVTIYQCGQLMPSASRGKHTASPTPRPVRYETRDGADLTLMDPLPSGKRVWRNEAAGDVFVER